jgi:putative aldouronate transport system substrate-binding protein
MKKAIAIILSVILVMGFTLQATAFTSVAVKRIKLNNSNISLKIGQTYNLRVAFTPANTTQKLIKFVSGNPKIAKVDSNGKITAVAAGATGITVISTTNKKILAKCNVITWGPVKLKLVTSDCAQPFPAGNQADIPELKYIKEKLGIELTIDTLAQAQFDDLWKMRVASGDIGDFYLGYGIDSICTNGGARDLTNLVNKYAPNAKKMINNAQWTVNKLGDKIYGLPAMPISNASSCLYVRKDWLDKLKLKVPKTSAEFLNMLKAFRDRDPNGNGKKDEIPFSARANNGWLYNIEGMFGVISSTHSKVNGEIVPSALDPKVKNYISYLKTMYDQKLIDPEFMINQRAQWEQKISAGLVGCWCHAPTLAWYWQDKLNQSIPEQKPVVMAIGTPVGTGNKTGFHGSYLNPWTQTWIVNKNCKNPEAVVRLYDWLLSKEGCTFRDLGVKGVTYEVDKTGAIWYNKDKDSAGTWRTYIFNFGPYDADAQAKINGPVSVEKIKQALDTVAKDNPIIPADIGIYGITDDSLMVDLRDKRFPEMVAQIVTGNQPLSYYDSWAKDQKTIAQPYIDEITKLAKEQNLLK